MKNLKYVFAGIVFGFVLTKGEAISWFRIVEMFRLEGFQLYGIFMSAIFVGASSLFLLRKFKITTLDQEAIVMPQKKYNKGIIPGGLIFGFGWALTGACPGPLYVLIGAGYSVTIITMLAAIAGTWTYALVQRHFPQ